MKISAKEISTWSVWAVLVAVLLMIPTAFAQEEDVAPQNLEDLQATFNSILEASIVPGAQIVLIEGGDVVLSYNYGLAHVATGAPVTDETVFRAGSISKSFVSVAVMMAQEEGLLTLDTPIAEIVPEVEFANGWEQENPVRISHVLEHTAGFYDITLAEFLISDPDISIAEGLAINPHTRVSRWAPGTYYSYANSGPPIAALALEHVRGNSYDDLLRDSILRPLGMDVSELRLTPEVDRRLSESYQDDGTTPVPYGHILMRPSGALNTTATELSHFVRMMINRGTLDGTRLLTPQSVDRIEHSETLHAIEYYGHDVAYGLGNSPSYAEKIVFRGHGGAIDGYLANYAYAADLGVGYVVMLNNSDSDTIQSLIRATTDFLTRDFEPDLPEPYAVDVQELSDFAGYYISKTPGSRMSHAISAFEIPFSVHFTEAEGLVVDGIPRIPNGEHTMRRPERAESSFTRTVDRTYRRELQYSGVTFVQVSLPQLVLRMVLSFGVGVGAIMALFYGLIIAPIGFFRSRKNKNSRDQNRRPQFMRTSALLAGACVAGILGIGAYASSLHYLELGDMATRSPLSLTLYALSILAPLFAAVGLWVTITGGGYISRWKRGYFIVANGLMLAGFLWLSQFGWLGLKSWTF